MMKAFVFFLAVILLSGVSRLGAKDEMPAAVKQAKEIVWAGLDYSKVEMIGQKDFREPNLFPDMLTTWNELFLDEDIDKFGKRLHKTVVSDIDGVLKLNHKATSAQIKVDEGKDEDSHWTAGRIAAEVKSYKLSTPSGVGLVLIIENMEKPMAYIDTVWFDVETREVLGVQSDYYKAGGFGFRNYWFATVKRAVKEIK
jgi:hypothetical protein